jgi:hypothetical protein
MQPDSASPKSEDSFAMRLGGAASGLLAGLFAGMLLGGISFVLEAEATAGWLLFVCLAIGTVAGYLSAAAGLGLLAGVAHFSTGVLHGFADERTVHSPLAPSWLRWLLYAGFCIGLVLLLIRRLW